MNLTFYMKSGNKFTINGVTEWRVVGGDESISSLTLTQEPPAWRKHKKLIVQSIDFKSIEAIVEER